MSNDNVNDDIKLSTETLKALQEFALQSGISFNKPSIDNSSNNDDNDDDSDIFYKKLLAKSKDLHTNTITNNNYDITIQTKEQCELILDPSSIIETVRKHFEVKDREDVFKISYRSKDNERYVCFEVKGIKRELGQTLDSTGLTM